MSDLASKVIWENGVDTITESEYGQILSTIFPEAWSSAADGFYYSLKARHIIYSHTQEGEAHFLNGVMTQNSDCAGGGKTNFDSSTKTQGIIETGLGLGLKFDPEPISKTVLAIVDGVMGFITKHHAQAVALEQKDICQASVLANQGFDVIDAGFYSGQMTQSQANSALANMKGELEFIVQPVQTATGRTKRTCNAACVIMLFFDGLVKLRTDYLYPQYATANILPTSVAGVVTAPGSVIADAVSGITGGAIKLSSGVALLLFIIIVALTLGIVKVNRP